MLGNWMVRLLSDVEEMLSVSVRMILLRSLERKSDTYT